MENDIQAILGGLAQGQFALQGLNPSGANPRGAPPVVDPAQKQFADFIAAGNALAQALERSGAASDSVDVQEYVLKAKNLMLQRTQKMQKMQADGAAMGGMGDQNQYRQPFPNVNAGGTL